MIATLALISALAGPVTAPMPADTAVLRVGSRPITVFRAPFGPTTPAERAAAAAARIRTALRDSARAVSTVPTDIGTMVTLGGRPMFAVLVADVDTAAGGTPQAAVAAATKSLTLAVEEYDEARAPASLARSAAGALAGTLLFLVLLRWFLIAQRRLTAWLSTRLTGAEVKVRGFRLIGLPQLQVAQRAILIALRWAVAVLGIYLWLAFVLRLFPWTRHWGDVLGTFLTTTVGDLGLGLVHAIPGLFTAFLIFVLARAASQLLTGLFRAVAEGSVALPGVHPDTALPTRQILVALVWLFAIAVAYPFLPGSGTDVFKGVSVFAGLLLTLGSTSVVGQGMSGLVLMYTRALRVGEFVRVGETEGTVTSIGMLSTKIRTARGEEVTLPSGVVLGTAVLNFSRLTDRAGAVLSSTVTIGYDAPWRQVHTMLLEAARRTPGTRAEPAPYVLQRALSDFYVEYELVVQVERASERIPTASALHGHIQDVFNEHGVQIMSPHYLGDPATAKVVPKELWFGAPAAPPHGEGAKG